MWKRRAFYTLPSFETRDCLYPVLVVRSAKKRGYYDIHMFEGMRKSYYK